MEDIQLLKNKIAEYEKCMGIGDHDPAKEGYLVLVDQLQQRNEYIKTFKVKDKIGAIVKDDPVYVRATELIDTLPKMITAVSNLRIELKMDGEEVRNVYKPISAKEIANGNV